MTSMPEPPPSATEACYQLERQLQAAFDGALKAQRSGASVDVRIYFREKPDGALWSIRPSSCHPGVRLSRISRCWASMSLAQPA